MGLLIGIAKTHPYRCYRKEYIMRWSHKSEELFKEFQKAKSHETADTLFSLLDKTRKEKWIKTVKEADFK